MRQSSVETTTIFDWILRRRYPQFSNFFSKKYKPVKFDQFILKMLMPNSRLKIISS